MWKGKSKQRQAKKCHHTLALKPVTAFNAYRFSKFSKSPLEMQSIVISVSVCLSVRPHISNHTSKFHQFFCTCYLAWSFSGIDAICDVLPVLCMTSRFHIMKGIGQNQRQCVRFLKFTGWQHQSGVRQGCLIVSTGGGIGGEVCRFRLHLVHHEIHQ